MPAQPPTLPRSLRERSVSSHLFDVQREQRLQRLDVHDVIDVKSIRGRSGHLAWRKWKREIARSRQAARKTVVQQVLLRDRSHRTRFLRGVGNAFTHEEDFA